jgi:hypothetical protein
MSKNITLPFDANQAVADLAAKGIAVEATNPNLAAIAASMGVTATVRRVERTENQKGDKQYLAVAGGARGRDAWFPVEGKDADALRQEATEIIAGLQHFLTTLAK